MTLILLLCALGMPTHALGDTAVFGRAYLWGESSARCNAVGEAGPELVWFVDGAEVAQHGAFGLVIALSLACLASRRCLGFVALSYAGLLALDLWRALEVDGSPVGVALPIFWLLAGWALVLCGLCAGRHARRRRDGRLAGGEEEIAEPRPSSSSRDLRR